MASIQRLMLLAEQAHIYWMFDGGNLFQTRRLKLMKVVI